jgi:hypothetical protein
MDGTRSAGELAREFASRYGLTEEEVARDLGAFLTELASRGAAETEEAPRPSLAPEAAPREPGPYAPPAIAESHTLEVLAAICDSSRTGGGQGGPPNPPPGTNCRADESVCKKLFE